MNKINRVKKIHLKLTYQNINRLVYFCQEIFNKKAKSPTNINKKIKLTNQGKFLLGSKKDIIKISKFLQL